MCTICGERKKRSSFYKKPNMAGGLSDGCRGCHIRGGKPPPSEAAGPSGSVLTGGHASPLTSGHALPPAESPPEPGAMAVVPPEQIAALPQKAHGLLHRNKRLKRCVVLTPVSL